MTACPPRCRRGLALPGRLVVRPVSSMHERAAELGGTLNAGGTPAGGRVLACLPLGVG